ncbi:MAG: quinol:electron acceptor oxidoreductase subunit ActD, partial [Acidobacteriota bacterium]
MSGVLGIFEQREDLLKAVNEARTENLGPLEAFSPVLDEDLIEAVSPGKSPVRRLTLLGAVTGGIFGLV